MKVFCHYFVLRFFGVFFWPSSIWFCWLTSWLLTTYVVFLLTTFIYFTYQFYEIDLKNTYKEYTILYFLLCTIFKFYEWKQRISQIIWTNLWIGSAALWIMGYRKPNKEQKTILFKLHIDKNCFIPKTDFYLKNVNSSETGMVILQKTRCWRQ